MSAQKAGSIEGASGRVAAGPLGAVSAWGPYVLGRRIGRGAMGVVHAAIHRSSAGIARLVAVKILVADRADHAEERAGFLREARILARLDHPNVVRWLDAGEVSGDVFIAMELLHGASIGQIVAASPERVPVPIAIAVLADLARGLHAAHELRDEAGQALGLVHQDVSPQNAVVGYDGRTRLVDFGIARLASVDASRTDTVRGKPAYLAPEQLEGRRLDRRTDVFALGVMAFEILAGRRLFARASIAETHTAVLFEPIPDLCAVRPELPADLAAVVACALSRSASGRFRTAEAFRRALIAARDDAGIPAADEREIADLVAARVPPPWQPHELFAEIDAGDAAPAEPSRGPSEGGASPHGPEVSQAVTIAPRREQTGPDPTEEATRAPVRGEASAMVGIPSIEAGAAEAMVGIPSIEVATEAAMVGIPSNEVGPLPERAKREIWEGRARAERSEHEPGGGHPSERLPSIPMARWPWWIRAVAGVAVAVVAIVVLGIVVARRRAVRVPAEDEAPPASAAVSGEAPKKHVEPMAEPSGSPAPPSSSARPRESAGRTSGPVASGSSAATGTLPGASGAATGALPGANGAAPSGSGTAQGASSAPATTPVLPIATSGQPISPEAPSSGWISVWSTPWGRVRVDGRDVGDSPAIRIAAPPGPHSVSVKSEGGEQSRGVTVKAGEEAKVRFVF